MAIDVLFLAWDSPWPAHFGGALRTLGLLTELGAAFDVELLVLTRRPLRDDQRAALAALSTRIIEIPLRDVTWTQRVRAILWGGLTGRPYHCAVVESSLRGHPDVRRRLQEYPGVVYASYGHWGTLVWRSGAGNWILDQQHANVDFWRTYRSQVSNPARKLFAAVNERLARHHFRDIYPAMGRVVSVCEEDRTLTLELAPDARVEVIPNGVDCVHFEPERTVRPQGRRLLFSGTAAPLNTTALRRLTDRILPLARATVPDVELVVAGECDSAVQAALAADRGIRFTGPMSDLRGEYNRSDVFVVPHVRTHGSQMKVAIAMAMGMAIVSSPEGIRGQPLVDGESVLVAPDDRSFGAGIAALLRDASLRERLGTAARRSALAHLDWRVLGPRVVGLVERVAGVEPAANGDTSVVKGMDVGRF